MSMAPRKTAKTTVINPVTLKDLMANFSPRSGASEEYCKGLIVGAVSGLISAGMTWREAITAVAENTPADARISSQSIPESWLDTFTAEFKRARQHSA